MTIMRTRRREADQRHGRVRRGRGLGLLAAMLLAAGLTASPAHAVGSSAGGRLLAVTAHDNGPSAAVQRDYYTLNTNQVKAGLVEVRLHNAGTVPHQVQLLRMHDGITLTSFVQAVAASHGAAVPHLSDATGGSNGVDPGGDQTTFVNLRAGTYIALCFLSDNGHGAPHFAHGMLSPFTVKGQGDSAHPPGHVFGDIDAFSFGYRMPAVVDGHGFYRFANTAAHDTHELAILRLAPQKTAADYLAWIKHGGQGRPPIVGTGGGAGALAPGLHSWVQLNLAAGQYVAVCFVPDEEGSHPPHAALGMVQGFSVPRGGATLPFTGPSFPLMWAVLAASALLSAGSALLRVAPSLHEQPRLPRPARGPQEAAPCLKR